MSASKVQFVAELDKVVVAYLADTTRYRLHRTDLIEATTSTGWSMAVAYHVLDADTRLARQGAGWVRSGLMGSP